MTNSTTADWRHKLIAAFVSGGSAGVSAGIVSMGIDGDRYNIHNLHGAAHLALMIIGVFVLKGFLKATGFLELNPTPWDGSKPDRRGA